jgi:hypothetical protein
MKDDKDKTKDEITLVAPNGAEMQIKYHPHDTVAKTLEHAVKEFAKDGHIDPGVPYLLVLGDLALENSLSLEAAGVKAGDRLKIRSKAIPGDGNASGIK